MNPVFVELHTAAIIIPAKVMIKNGSRTYVRATSPPLGGGGSVVVFISDTNEASPYVFSPSLSLSLYLFVPCLWRSYDSHMVPLLLVWAGPSLHRRTQKTKSVTYFNPNVDKKCPGYRKRFT